VFNKELLTYLLTYYPLLNASEQNKYGVCQFSPACVTNRLP